MSAPELYQWTKAFHVVGFLLWTGSLLSCIYLLQAHQAAGEEGRQALSSVQRKAAMLMEIGALVAIVAGLYLALGGGRNAFSGAGWLHAKLALVVLGLFGLHGFVRVKIKKFRNGEVAALPGWLQPAALVVIVVVAIMASVKPF